jgi:hypothetical protein
MLFTVVGMEIKRIISAIVGAGDMVLTSATCIEYVTFLLYCHAHQRSLTAGYLQI